MGTRFANLVGGAIGGVAAVLAMSLLPAVAGAGDAATQSVMNPGDPLKAGRVNLVDASTWIRGKAANGNLRVHNETDGPALTLFAQPNQPPLKVNNKVRIDQLNADLVDSLHANQLLRSAHANNGTMTINGPTAEREVTIVVPKSGYLVATASLQFTTGSEADQVSCGLFVRGRGYFGNTERHTSAAAHEYGVCATNGTRAVPAGTHTVVFELWNVGPNTIIFGNTLDVIYIPFGASGGTPAPSELAAASDDPAAAELSRRLGAPSG